MPKKNPALEALRKDLKKRFKDASYYSAQELKRILPTAIKVLELDEEYRQLSDAELKAKTPQFRERLANGESLESILPEAFAAVREATWRVDKKRHYPVQILCGILLHQGRIAEMKTGEGKTHMAVLPAYLNGLTGEGVHIVTVNDYLARRDSEWMGKIYRFMGLTVGLIVHDLENEDAVRLTRLILPMARTTRWDLITFVTTWCNILSRKSSESMFSPLWTRWTPFSLTKPARR